MNSATGNLAKYDWHKIQQIVKWVVYSLLIVNFGFYIWEDTYRAIHTMHEGSTWFDWLGQFATTIDTSAWLIMILMFELETYQLEDEQWKTWVAKTVRGARIVCYLMIAHTVVQYTDSVMEYSPTQPLTEVSSLCDLADKGHSYVYNLEYTDVTADNCADIVEGSEFFKLGKNFLVVNEDGLHLERKHAWADLIEIITWLVIIFAIEVIVRLQSRDIVSGRLMSVMKNSKRVGYAVLLALSIFWANLGHWLYTWDTFVWIAGFAAIEMNVSEWRDEILSEDSPTNTNILATAD
ncbi:MAG: hypothetical protein AAF385_15200 [Pseudomonadota bacterium]